MECNLDYMSIFGIIMNIIRINILIQTKELVEIEKKNWWKPDLSNGECAHRSLLILFYFRSIRMCSAHISRVLALCVRGHFVDSCKTSEIY